MGFGEGFKTTFDRARGDLYHGDWQSLKERDFLAPALINASTASLGSMAAGTMAALLNGQSHTPAGRVALVAMPIAMGLLSAWVASRKDDPNLAQYLSMGAK